MYPSAIALAKKYKCKLCNYDNYLTTSRNFKNHLRIKHKIILDDNKTPTTKSIPVHHSRNKLKKRECKPHFSFIFCISNNNDVCIAINKKLKKNLRRCVI